MTDFDALFADRRYPELVRQARAALRRRLSESGVDRPVTADEEAVLAAGALLVDGVYAELGRMGQELRGPLAELAGVRPRGSRAARTRVRFTFDGSAEKAGEEPAESPGGWAGEEPAESSGARAGEEPAESSGAPAGEEPVELPAGLELTGPGLSSPFTTLDPVRGKPGTEVVVTAVHARRIADEPLGIGDGSAGQRFRLRHPPTAVPGRDPVVQTSAGDGWTDWAAVESPVAGRPYVLIDPARAEIRFPPEVVLAPETVVRIRGYWVGGGAGGNRPAGALTRLCAPPPGVRVRVVSTEAALGGRDAETVADAWARLPGTLRTGDRAVTAADHEELSRRADPSLARVCCRADEGVVRVLLVAAPPPGRELRPTADDLRPSADTLGRVAAFLEERRLLGTRLLVEPPAYQGVSVTVRAVAEDGAREAVLAALYAYLHPVTGGADGAGWPVGRSVADSMIKKVVFAVPGVRDVPGVLLWPVDLRTGVRGGGRPVLPLGPAALPLSVDHRVVLADR